MNVPLGNSLCNIMKKDIIGASHLRDCSWGLLPWRLGNRRYNNMDRMVESSISCVSWAGEHDKPEGERRPSMMDVTRYVQQCRMSESVVLWRYTPGGWRNTNTSDASCGDINLLNPTGHVMHQQFNIQQLYVLPTLYLCVLYLSENKQRLVPLTA